MFTMFETFKVEFYDATRALMDTAQIHKKSRNISTIHRPYHHMCSEECITI